MIDAAIDTVVFHHACRGTANTHQNVLDRHVVSKKLRVALDPDLAIADEWKKTAGTEIVNVLITKWADCKGIRIVPALGRVPPAITKALRQAGFCDVIDKLLVRVAIVIDG